MTSSRKKKFTQNVLRRNFTVVELITAMTVLIVLMLVLTRFFTSAESVWTLTSKTTEIYENARIAFDLITRDLQGAVARSNDQPGSHIYFEEVANDTLRFVTSAETPTTTATTVHSRLFEVGYQFQNEEFQRAWVNEDNANWNVYGSRDSDSVNQQTGYQKVISGVLGATIVCYDESFTAPATWNGTSYETKLPSMVRVTMTLLDHQSYEKWQRLSAGSDERTRLESEVARTFSKNIFLGNRNQTP